MLDRRTIALSLSLGTLAAVAIMGWVLRVGGQDLPRPPGLAAPTATPDTRSAVDSTKAAEQLSAQPNLGKLIAAIRTQDVDAVLDLIDWQPQPCGLRNTDVCPPGVEPYTELPMVDAGFPDPFWVTAETLRPTLTLLLGGEPLPVRVALRSKENPNLYQIAFASRPKGSGLLPLAAPSASLTGLFFTADASASRPIDWLYPVSEQWSATDQAFAFGLDDKEIIAWDDRY